MQIGIFADSHDHLNNIRRAVQVFNDAECEYVLFAGDLVSTFAVPPLRRLGCPLVAAFGDSEGNRIGLQAGFSILGTQYSGNSVFWFKIRNSKQFNLKREMQPGWGFRIFVL